MVKVLITEDGSDVASVLVESASELITASIGYVEARAALARAARDGRLPRKRRECALASLESLWEGASIVELSLDLVARAGALAEQRRLRAGDAIHLASALMFDEPDLVLASWDTELRAAAAESGLAVAP